VVSVITTVEEPPKPLGVARLWRRELDAYPGAGARVAYLAIVVLTTVLFYYQYYVISGVSDQVIATTGASFMFFVNINVVSALASALTSALGGIADRIGRANIVTVGVLLCAALCTFGFPYAHGKWSVAVLYAVLGAIEGTVLVATPALVRDFSPQMGRASAMGFWTIGPVAGSLITSAVVTNTIAHLGAWQDEYVISGIVGFGVFGVALVWLRELAPNLRDQVMVSERDRVLVEAKARGIDVDGALRHPWRQMLKADVIGPAVAISLFLIIYYTAVGFFPLFFQTVFGYSTSKANELGNWMWGFQAFGLVAIGWASDRLRVRKPFMLVGAVGAVVTTLVFMAMARHQSTSFGDFAVVLSVLAITLGLTFAPWMAAFTETVERRNPALSATGLSIWGLLLRIVVTVSTFILPYVVHSVTTVADYGTAAQAAAAGKDPSLTRAQNAIVRDVVANPAIVTKVEALAGTYRAQLATAAKIDPATQAALSANPNDPGAQLKALAEISGAGQATVLQGAGIYLQYPGPVATVDAIDATTKRALLANPADAAALARATSEVAAADHVSATAAEGRVHTLMSVPPADLSFMVTTGAPVVSAINQLEALASMPSSASTYLTKYGTPLQDPKVQSTLKLLQKVQTAQQSSQAQWQHYFWIAVAGEIVFIPLMFLMAGFWDPRRARRAEEAHEAMVAAELAKLR
jgi:MFS family permease